MRCSTAPSATVECGENNEASVTMGKYGLIGHTAYVAENKDDLYLNQLEFFRRALNNEESPETEVVRYPGQSGGGQLP